MRVMRFVMVFCLLLTVSCMCMAQTSSDQNQPANSSDQQMNMSTDTQSQAQTSQDIKASVELGPVLKLGMQPSADVFVGKKLALRVGAPAAGMSPMHRAQIIADRLNQAFAAGHSWQNLTVDQKNGLWTVNLEGKLIATADYRSAHLIGTSSGYLARRWASGTVVAMGGEPQRIAMQLQPTIRERVAGSQEQLPRISWTTSVTKSVPVYSAVTGNDFGTITVAGAQSALDAVNSVMLYQSTSGQATIWTFVPVTATSYTDTLTRVAGVGVISIPSALIPTSGFISGNRVMQMTSSMAAQWNSAISSTLKQENLQTNANAKVVPLYSMDSSKIVGAVQIIGSSSGVRQAKTVVTSSSDTMMKFDATTAPYTPSMEQPSAQKDVLLSSIIMVSPPTVAPPALPELAPKSSEQPTSVEPVPTIPTTTEPSLPQPEKSQPAPSGSSNTPAIPEEGTPGSGF